MEPSKKPLNVLAKQLDMYVGITLKNGFEYRGKMIRSDNYMNILLDGASEYVNDQLVANYGSILLRGNNILYISLTPPEK